MNKLPIIAPYIYDARYHLHPYILSTTLLSDSPRKMPISHLPTHISDFSYHPACNYSPTLWWYGLNSRHSVSPAKPRPKHYLNPTSLGDDVLARFPIFLATPVHTHHWPNRDHYSSTAFDPRSLRSSCAIPSWRKAPPTNSTFARENALYSLADTNLVIITFRDYVKCRPPFVS